MGKNSGQMAPYQQSFDSGANAAKGFGQSVMDAATMAPGTPNYMNAAQQQAGSSQQVVGQQTQANRPNQQTPFGFGSWKQNPDGSWTQSVGLSGGLGDAATGLSGQAAGLGQAMDWSQFGRLDDGSAARDQAISAAYGQATSRLNPQWQRNETLNASALANQGLDPNSAAYRNQMSQLGQQKNDAYSSAMNSAIMQGTQAQQATFNQNLMARQQAIAEALRKRGQPLDELKQLQGFTAMPSFMGAQAADPTQYLAALMGQSNYDLGKWQTQQQMLADIMQGGGQLANAGGSAIGGAGGLSGLFALSDLRAKTNVKRLDVEAMPGVPFATWDYLPEHGGARGFGVIAQDLERVRPDLVTERDGLKHVDYSFLRGDA